jgi:hypothetical protein
MTNHAKMFVQAASVHEQIAHDARIQMYTKEDWQRLSDLSSRHYSIAIQMYQTALKAIDKPA